MNVIDGCPTCTHSLARLCSSEGIGYLHCERCGTAVVSRAGVILNAYTPKLVERCRKFQDHGKIDFVVWHRLGIDESIWPPEDRL